MSRAAVAGPDLFARRLWRVLIYGLLIVGAVYYLLPFYVMLTNSLKPQTLREDPALCQ